MLDHGVNTKLLYKTNDGCTVNTDEYEKHTWLHNKIVVLFVAFCIISSSALITSGIH